MAWVRFDVKLRPRLVELKGGELKVFVSLALHVGDDGLSWPSITTVAQETGLDPKTVRCCQQGLSSKGFISLVKPGGQGPHSVNFWRVHLVSYGNNNNKEGAHTPLNEPTQKNKGDVQTPLIEPWDPIAKAWKQLKGAKSKGKDKGREGYWEANAFLDLAALLEGVPLVNFSQLLGLIRPLFVSTRASVEETGDCYTRMRADKFWATLSPSDVIAGLRKWLPTYIKLKQEGKLNEFLTSYRGPEGGRGVKRLPTTYTRPESLRERTEEPGGNQGQLSL